MATMNAQKCAHPVCSCTTTSGKYCSTQWNGNMNRNGMCRMFGSTAGNQTEV
jgi:hypothetical protein